jgi:ribonucleotide reductase alpha subunit
MTNISVNYDDASLVNGLENNKVFIENVRQAMQTGEPGFSFNFGKKQNETLRNACFSADTLIYTTTGDFPIAELVGKSATIWDGDRYVVIDNFRVTGENQEVFKITLNDGSTIKATAYHTFYLQDNKKVELSQLKPGMSLLNANEALQAFPKESNWNLITKIESDGIHKKVYCCTVPNTHKVTLANGIITGQCTEVTSEDDSDVCNLGSVNLGNISSIEEFKDVVNLASKFLVCGTIRADLPYEKVYKVREKNRRLGLGLMGIHEWLLQRNEKYEVTPELHQWLKVYEDESERSANEHCDRFYLNHPVAYRAIAPTGSIGIIAGTTTGIEPLFAVAYKRRFLTEGTKWKYQYVVDGTAKTLIDVYGIKPESIDTALDLSTNYEQRIKFQADIQDYVDMSISSTINIASWGSDTNNPSKLPEFTKVLAKYAPRLRGFTCYPDGSRGGQPLTSVPYEEALKHKDTIYDEVMDVCSLTGGGTCGS